MRIEFRKPRRKERLPADLTVRRVLRRADRLSSQMIAVSVSSLLLGDPPYERSALAARDAELSQIAPWAPSGRISAARQADAEVLEIDAHVEPQR